MKIVLLDDIWGVGDRGEVVDVAAGYARNALIPRRLALRATPAAIRVATELNRSQERKEAKVREEAQAKASKMKGLKIRIEAKAGEEGKLFGSVTTTDVAEALAKLELGFDIDKKDVMLKTAIKRTGTYAVPVKLFRNIRSDVSVTVFTPEVQKPKKAKKAAPAPAEADAEAPVAEGDAAEPAEVKTTDE